MATTAIILAAGKGTRMKSDLPKVLHPVCNRPMLGYVLDSCRAAGCQKLLVVVGHKAEMVKAAFAGQDRDIVYIPQEPQLGTGHAALMCLGELKKLSGPVLVLVGDGPLIRAATLKKLLDTHAASGAACTLATSILPETTPYGRIIRDEKGDLVSIIEYPEATAAQRAIREMNVSLYCFDAASLISVLPRLTNANSKGEYYLTDTLAMLRADGKKLAAVAAVPPEEVMGINTIDDLADVSRIMAARESKGCCCSGGAKA